MARMAPEVRFNADTMSYMSFEPMDAEDMTYELKTEKWHKIKLAVDQILEDKPERPYTDDSICGPIDPQSCMLLLAQGAGMSKGKFNPPAWTSSFGGWLQCTLCPKKRGRVRYCVESHLQDEKHRGLVHKFLLRDPRARNPPYPPPPPPVGPAPPRPPPPPYPPTWKVAVASAHLLDQEPPDTTKSEEF